MMNLSDIIKGFENLSCEEKQDIKKQLNFDWKHILPNLKLPEHILELFADQLNLDDVKRYQNVSQKFLDKYMME